MVINLLENNKIYSETYRALVSAGKDRTKSTAMHYTKVYNNGLDKPMETLLYMKAAKRDYEKDILMLDGINKNEKKLNKIKTFFFLLFDLGYKKSKKNFNNSLKEIYPNSYKKRIKLVNKDKIAIYNKSITKDRLSKLNIKEL